MSRALRPTTIIPSHLYVERAADRQLDRIIEEMGRPGYVLVARQMGKTNLLINMKRRREKLGDLVFYFDLSTRFEDSRSLFRFIIDSIIESDEKIACRLSKKINGQRETQDSSPNLEYDRHLRLILDAAEGRRIIIVLDEIDSLISVDYSDVFFAQIRSMYFSRINHPIYQNLTYVLSGVAEPTDLIKDKHISPFNIGEKIFLDDFSYIEFSQLLANAELKFSDDIKHEIYRWTAGNPRMTWDICAELEDAALTREPLETRDVVAAVEKLYLTRFDRAPIDHIRVLAESDPQVRSAIVSIRWGKAASLDEKSKSRLYLAGISGGGDAFEPKIKNPIIDAALSDAWLTQIAASQKSLLDLAAECFEGERHAEAIQLIQDYVRQQPADYSLDPINKLRLGMSQFYEQRYDDSVQTLRDNLAEKNVTREFLGTCNYYIGSGLLAKRDFNDSIPFLEKAAETDGRFRLAAKLALTSAYVGLGSKDNIASIKTISQNIFDEYQDRKIEGIATDEDARLNAAAYFNLSQAHRAVGENKIADEFVLRALEISPVDMKPALLLRPYQHNAITEEIADFAEKAASHISETKIALAKAGLSSLAFTEGVLALALLRLQESGRDEKFSELLAYAVGNLYGHARRPFDVLIHLLRSSPAERVQLTPLLWTALERYQDNSVNSEHLLEALRFALELSTGTKRREAAKLYFDAVRSRAKRREDFSVEDLLAILNAVSEYMVDQANNDAIELAELGREVVSQNPSEYWVFGVVLLRQKLQIFTSQRKFDKAREVAERLMLETDANYSHRSALDGVDTESLLAGYREAAQRVLFDPSTDPLRKIGRNERVVLMEVESGRTLTLKFKFAVDHIKSGKYKFLSREKA
jgi:tetratricopeptide (TPR) repeat protein